MTPYYADEWLTILEGDCRAVLPTLPADSVDCVVTSPPYWGLRDYGTATWTGGNEACDHSIVGPGRAQRPAGGLTGGKAHVDAGTVKGGNCGRCGATRQDSQLGLERTPEEYVANLVAVFAEVRRVLKPSGTCWLNLGDSYASDMKGSGGDGTRSGLRKDGRPEDSRITSAKKSIEHQTFSGQRIQHGLKPKDLVGIPWRVAFALQADGWFLRSDIIWSKPNPMPESVTDRPTKSHEYLFLLTKSARYYFDADAVRESATRPGDVQTFGGAKARDGEPIPADDPRYRNGKEQWGRTIVSGLNGRNIRSVWTIATRPYPGGHFAVFPPELPERCIKAGSSERGVCPECGAPWERVIERSGADNAANEVMADYDVPGLAKGSSADRVRRLSGATYQRVVKPTNSWKPTCLCDGAEWTPTPALVLDPFAGSGTVGLVANRLSRRAILIDLNPEYLRQQMERNAQTPLGLGAA